MVVLCFSLVSRVSFENVRDTWIPEIKRETGGRTPIVLVATKKDLVRPERKASLQQMQDSERQQPVSAAELETLSKQIGAASHHQSSALTGEGVTETFDGVLRACFLPPAPAPACCNII